MVRPWATFLVVFLLAFQARAQEAALGLGLGMGVGCAQPEVRVQVSQGDAFGGVSAGLCESWRFALQAGLRLFSSPVYGAASLDVSGGALGFGLQALYRQEVLPAWPLLPWPGLSLDAVLGISLIRLPMGMWIPSPRATLGFTVSWGLSPEGLWKGESGGGFAVGSAGAREYQEPTSQSLLRLFQSLLESTRSSVIASLSGLYTDFFTDLQITDVSVVGKNAVTVGTYNVGATRRTDGKRLTQNLHLLHSLHKPAFPLTSSGGGCQRPRA